MHDLVTNYISTRTDYRNNERLLSKKLPKGISPQTYILLWNLSTVKACDKSAMAALLGVTLPQITALTDGLRTKGLIKEVPGKKDRRSRVMTLTPKAESLMVTVNG